MSDRNEMLSNDINNAYIAILKEELRPAMGCTEPIAIAYAAAKAREVLGALPDRLVLEVKYDDALPYAVRQLLRPLSAARCAISKYELCRGLQ